MKECILLLLLLFNASFVVASDNEDTSLQYDIMGNQFEQPSCLGQSAASTLNWLLCCGGAICGLFACCIRTPQSLCDDPTSCNPLQKKYLDQYQPEQQGLCHEGCFLGCACCYKNQIPYEQK